MTKNPQGSIIPQKCRWSARLRSILGVAENPQGNTSQPIELSSLVREQCLQPESQDQENRESDHEEEAEHSRDEQ